ncbi:MAG: DUF819 family protein [Flavobacteriales bacterium]|nr:DUF819 family protein [Flavobacteriales bacterium]
MPLSSIIQVLIMLSFPILVLEVVKRNKLAGMVGPVILCYAVGLIVGNLPDSPVNVELSQTVAEAMVPLAISLMLLSTRFMAWVKYAKQTAKSFALAVVAVLVSSFAVSAYFHLQEMGVDDVWKLSGMMVGVYTGGTPNLAAIGTALGISNEVFIVLNACDLILSALYLLLLLSVAQKIALKFLPSFVPKEKHDRDETFHYQRVERMASRKTLAKAWSMAFLLSAGIVGASIGFSILVDGKITAPSVILAVTTLSIAASFVRKIRFLPRTYEFGEFFLLVFCMGIGSISNIQEMLQASPNVLFYVTCVFLGTLSVHFLLSWIFRIDADTTLITSVAGIFGPAFIGPVASVLKNKDIVVSGLTTGLVGYAIANYLGLGMAQVFHLVFP